TYGLSLLGAIAIATQPLVTREAFIFGLTQWRLVTIELLPCPVCHHFHCHLDPDLSNYGVFNWNNTMLFSYKLINGYTNAYTASEIQFSAFWLIMQRGYMEYGNANMFRSDDTFVCVCFAFMQIQELNNGMMCSTCGVTPDIVIADGISLGTHVSKLTSSVCPPT
ncbi:hypothetical protein EV363DRAFT_1149279, partial [Boletus edulis]